MSTCISKDRVAQYRSLGRGFLTVAARLAACEASLLLAFNDVWLHSGGQMVVVVVVVVVVVKDILMATR